MSDITDKELLAICNLSNLKMELLFYLMKERSLIFPNKNFITLSRRGFPTFTLVITSFSIIELYIPSKYSFIFFLFPSSSKV